MEDDMYYWENSDDCDDCGYASSLEEVTKEVKNYIEEHSNEIDSVSIYKKIYIATPLVTAEIKAVE